MLTIQNDNEVVGIAPLIKQDETICLMGDPDLFDHQDFLPASTKEDIFFEAVVDFLDAQNWSFLSLRSLRPTSATLKYFPALCENRGFAVRIEQDGDTPIAELPETWEDYVTNLGKKRRHELRRKIRRLENTASVGQNTHTDSANILNGMEQFFELMRTSRDDKRDFLTAERQAFFKDIALESEKQGQFRLSFLEIDGEQVAGCIAFDYGDDYLLYNSGLNPAYSSLSVGLINKVFCLKDAIQAGKRTFNFLKGSERYKFDLGAVSQPLYRIEVSR